MSAPIPPWKPRCRSRIGYPFAVRAQSGWLGWQDKTGQREPDGWSVRMSVPMARVLPWYSPLS